MDWLPGVTLTGPQRTFVQLVGIAATVAAAWFAYWSIRKSGKQAKRAADALVRERRLDFELDLLKELAEVLTWPQGRPEQHEQLALRLRMLPSRGLELCRRASGIDGPTERQAVLDGRDIHYAMMPDGRSVQEHLLEEVQQAIRTRLEERS